MIECHDKATDEKSMVGVKKTMEKKRDPVHVS
jgi:hypothetical protein